MREGEAEALMGGASRARAPQRRLHTRPCCIVVTLATLATLATLVASTAAVAAPPPPPAPLAQRQDDAAEFTVSGHSSGGSMASQHFFAFSDRIKGLGHFQAAPYGCSKLPVRPACTTQPELISVEEMAVYAVASALEGRIAPLEGVRERPIYVNSGGQDSVVRALVNIRAAELYGRFSDRVEAVELPLAQHAFITDDSCPSSVCSGCGTLGSPFLNDCGYDMAGAMLAHLYGTLEPRGVADSSRIREVNQADFFPSGSTPSSIGMNERAFVYVPQRCSADTTACRVHVMYHGCNSGVDTNVGDRIFTWWGGNAWAESNDLLILYPQAFASNCWDWTGSITDERYDTRLGLQVNVVNRMVDALAAGEI